MLSGTNAPTWKPACFSGRDPSVENLLNKERLPDMALQRKSVL
jgi:hypothetical protein